MKHLDAADTERFRRHLENERSFLAWLRAAAVTMGIGYVMARLGRCLDEHAQAGARSGALYWGGWALTVAGALALAVSSARYYRAARTIDIGKREAVHEHNERTLLAWVRTATALLVLGCAIVQFAAHLQRHAITRVGEAATYATGVIMLFISACAVILGIDDYHRRRSALGLDGDGDDDVLHSRALYPLAILVGLAGTSLLVLLAFQH